jgi:hypothetical protein
METSNRVMLRSGFTREGPMTSPVSISWSRFARNGSQAAQKRGKNDATSSAKP